MKDQLISGLCQVHKNLKKEKRKACTKSFFEKLKVLAPNGCVTYSNLEPKTGEWLFDLIWSQENKKDWTKFDGLYLVCESEWDMDYEALLMDFQKLMVAKANIKLFICQGCQYENRKLFSLLAESIPDKYKTENETWILFISDDNDLPTYWIWQYDNKGQMIPDKNKAKYVWK